MSDSLPVEIVPYDPSWPQLFISASREILAAIGDYVAALEHIGSTAVPGLAAKPVIDILVGVKNLEDAPAFLPPLFPLGYHYLPRYEAELPQRRYLERIRAGQHTHHVHIVTLESDFFRTHLLFRDALRADPALAADYAALKIRLAAQYRTDRSAYTDGKSAFIQSVLNNIPPEDTRQPKP